MLRPPGQRVRVVPDLLPEAGLQECGIAFHDAHATGGSPPVRTGELQASWPWRRGPAADLVEGTPYRGSRGLAVGQHLYWGLRKGGRVKVLWAEAVARVGPAFP